MMISENNRHTKFFLKWVLPLLAFVLVAVIGTAQATEDEIYTGFFSDHAVGGYDPVAYFRQNKAVKGHKSYQWVYKDAEWLFSSAENLALFKQDPERYAPAYGGYCAWAMAQGIFASSDPKIWAIIDDRLFLNYDQEIQDLWEKDIAGFIGKADQQWPEVLIE